MQHVGKHGDFSVKHGGTHNKHSSFKGQNISYDERMATGRHDETNSCANTPNGAVTSRNSGFVTLQSSGHVTPCTLEDRCQMQASFSIDRNVGITAD